jgi:DnaJ-class molecular chaperone
MAKWLPACLKCKGSGKIDGKKCPLCEGKGKISKSMYRRIISQSEQVNELGKTRN